MMAVQDTGWPEVLEEMRNSRDEMLLMRFAGFNGGIIGESNSKEP